MNLKRDLAKELLEGISEIKAGEGKRYAIGTPEDIVEIRRGLSLSQSVFSALLGVSSRTLQDWEQGRRFPRGPALSLLRIAKDCPEAFIKAHIVSEDQINISNHTRSE